MENLDRMLSESFPLNLFKAGQVHGNSFDVRHYLLNTAINIDLLR